MDLVGEINRALSVMTGFVLESFSGIVLVVQEVLRTVIIAPYRKAILVLCPH
jgi:hypothetical protein